VDVFFETRCRVADNAEEAEAIRPHIFRIKDERLVKTLTLHVSVVEGDRPPGRPARRWSDDGRLYTARGCRTVRYH